MSQYIQTVYRYLETTYRGRVFRDEITKKFWEFYLTDEFEFNPKYFKFTGSWIDNNGRESIISANLPDSVVRQAGKTVDEKTYQTIKDGVINSIKRQAIISEFQKEKRLDFFPEIINILVDSIIVAGGAKRGAPSKRATQPFAKSWGALNGAVERQNLQQIFFIQMEKIKAKNVFQFFFENPTFVPPELLSFSTIMSRLMQFQLPNELNYDKSFIIDRLNRASKGLILLNIISGIKKTNIQLPKADLFIEKDTGVLYADCTPHNFLIRINPRPKNVMLNSFQHPKEILKQVQDDNKQNTLIIVDLETMGNFYLNFSLAYNLIYFLIHLPYLNAQPERKKIIDEMEKLVTNKEIFHQSLLVCFLAHAGEVIEFSKSRTDQILHKNLVDYNIVVAKKILSGADVSEMLV
ncbi:hypothetical protein A3C23_05050 [Candidatus Roizmanbacteria bacterium RIFCSPHIGHO2_02_FULL_37_13b]|uniref:Uncharacterized protein n=1 Tax=Candidatus Roizmanbacteria bacterium RIFCSPLOWO2_02_FULL_36_11 TaxID=1802071 RepID=A0A1F7JIM2_9BACT|nr:MAG: hypothetical protein A3C23_05050 [Candidatus Roizmanbacteria bacterium RIFCSPHIGHO2_02_FULL_37_13b]OGK55462.1 MAG: hypothetical protein A3H78_01235 [Candidatus Roizmanbacteria bacterium RIFCSPLOWO2_02_FULL_36_11]